MEVGQFYVYVIYRLNGTPCYVGKGKGRRYKLHFWRPQNPHLASIIAQAGGNLPVTLVRENMIEPEAMSLERELIKRYGREDRGGILVNLTDGGDGFSGGRHSEAVRKLISAAHKGKDNHCRGIKQTPETIAKRVAKVRGQKRTTETRKKMSESICASAIFQERMRERRGVPLSAATREKMRRTALGRVISPTQRELARQAMLGKPGFFTGKKHSEEAKRKMRAAHAIRRKGVVGLCGHSEELDKLAV